MICTRLLAQAYHPLATNLPIRVAAPSSPAQGNPRLLDTMKETLQSQGKAVTMFLVSELSPQRLALVRGIDAWVQVGCVDVQCVTSRTREAHILRYVAPSCWPCAA